MNILKSSRQVRRKGSFFSPPPPPFLFVPGEIWSEITICMRGRVAWRKEEEEKASLCVTEAARLSPNQSFVMRGFISQDLPRVTLPISPAFASKHQKNRKVSLVDAKSNNRLAVFFFTTKPEGIFFHSPQGGNLNFSFGKERQGWRRKKKGQFLMEKPPQGTRPQWNFDILVV